MAKKNAKDEIFYFLDTAWDIEKADKILKKKPREPEITSVVEPQKMVSIPGGPVRFGGVFVDPEHVKKADITLPIYIALIKFKSCGKAMLLPIDGWHRIAKAAMAGITELPAFFFTLRESNSIRIR